MEGGVLGGGMGWVMIKGLAWGTVGWLVDWYLMGGRGVDSVVWRCGKEQERGGGRGKIWNVGIS